VLSVFSLVRRGSDAVKKQEVGSRKARKEPVDNTMHYRETEYPARDKVFNWVVRRYGLKGNKWKTSDDVIFGGVVYHVWDWIPILLFIYFVYFITTWVHDKYGLFRALVVLAIMVIMRLNAVVRKLDQINRRLSA
jgi:hypothetical protein